jgi:hypothetical protein
MNGWNIGLYGKAVTEASKSALIEVLRALSSYADYFVLGGGWAPYYIIESFSQEREFQHCGSVDIDLIMDPELRDASRYATIVEILSRRGYRQHVEGGRRFLYRFDKTIVSPVDGRPYDVSLDFITEPPETRLQEDLVAAGIRGCSVALDHYFLHSIRSILPGDGEAVVKTKILDIVGCLVTKGLAIVGRLKEKDPYDIYAVVSCYKGGPLDVAKEVQRYISEPIVSDAIENIRKQFLGETSEGPYSVGRFMYPGDADMQRTVRMDAFMQIDEFLKNLDL